MATTGDPTEGGVIVCQELGCLCYGTWGVNGAQPRYVPTPEEFERIRDDIQTRDLIREEE